uniref:Uncharacterized protein n=1 Tax=Pristionchus pacificus TaxID=54126 RepID=A0A2A6CVK8_PRIPA|eukprot:PDM82061.1 hypothetical protein PRIPAC_36454 [Pristionchus pacificus]
MLGVTLVVERIEIPMDQWMGSLFAPTISPTSMSDSSRQVAARPSRSGIRPFGGRSARRHPSLRWHPLLLHFSFVYLPSLYPLCDPLPISSLPEFKRRALQFGGGGGAGAQEQ